MLSIVGVLLLLNHMVCEQKDNQASRVTLESHWDVSVRGEKQQDINLNSFRFHGLHRGDVVELTTVLPEEWAYKAPVLCVPITQNVVDVYVDDELIYQYGQERYELNKNVGNGLRFVHLDNAYKGARLRIVMRVAEEYAFSSLKPIWISDWQDAYRIVVTENRLPLLLGIFLLVFGIVMSILLTAVMVYDSRFWYIFFVAVFSLCIGLWTLCYNDVLVIFSIPPHAVTLIENMSLLFAPLAVVGHMYVYVKQLKNIKITMVYNVLLVLQIFSTVLTIILHIFDIIHSAESLNYHYVSYMLLAVFFAYLLFESARRNAKYRTVYYVGMSIVIFTILYELISYAVNRYLGNSFLLIKGISAMGVIAFISVILLDLYHDIILRKMEAKEKEMLLRRAYTDELTQVHNRSYCSEYMKSLHDEDIKEYAIISFDINNLKDTNDRYGHSAGDLLLKNAALKLSEVFEEKGIIGRMGGDEFIAVIPSGDRDMVEKLIAHFRDSIHEENAVENQEKLSVAFGYALSTEIQGEDVEQVYKLADDRMYQCKREIKKHAK